MKYDEILVSLFASILQSMIIYYYLENKLPSRIQSHTGKMELYSLMALLFTGIELFVTNPIVLFVVSSGIIVAVELTYQGSIRHKCNAFMILVGIRYGMMFLSIVQTTIFAGLVSLLSNVGIEVVLKNTVFYMQGSLVANALVFIAFRIINQRHTHLIPHRAKFRFIVQLLIFPLVSVITIFIISVGTFDSVNSGHTTAVFFISLLLVIANIFVFHLFEQSLAEQQEKMELDFMKDQISHQRAYYKELLDKQKTIHQLSHDMKNSLLAISGYLARKDYQAANDKIDTLCQTVIQNTGKLYTGNSVIDSFINAKENMAQTNGILFQSKIATESTVLTNEYDFCILIGNALDNAVEACLRIQGQKEKQISLKILQTGDYISITVKNSSGLPNTVNCKHLQTEKKDQIEHGYGIESMKTIVKKYNGNICFQNMDGIFTVTILLQNISPST